MGSEVSKVKTDYDYELVGKLEEILTQLELALATQEDQLRQIQESAPFQGYFKHNQADSVAIQQLESEISNINKSTGWLDILPRDRDTIQGLQAKINKCRNAIGYRTDQFEQSDPYQKKKQAEARIHSLKMAIVPVKNSIESVKDVKTDLVSVSLEKDPQIEKQQDFRRVVKEAQMQLQRIHRSAAFLQERLSDMQTQELSLLFASKQSVQGPSASAVSNITVRRRSV